MPLSSKREVEFAYYQMKECLSEAASDCEISPYEEEAWWLDKLIDLASDRRDYCNAWA